MVIPLRAGLAAGFAAALAFATSGLHPHAPRPQTSPNPLLAADPPDDGPNAIYAGGAALAVGGLGIFARTRRR